MDIVKLNFFLSFFLLALLNSCTTEESGVPIEKTMDDSFFTYSGNEFAMEDIIGALKMQNDSTRFVPYFLKTYGQPVWSSKKIISIGGEAIVAVPVKQPGKQEIETIWLFFAHGNRMTYFPLTKQMAANVPADVEWTFDYFTQELYPNNDYSVKFMTQPENQPQTKGYVWTFYCVDYWVKYEYAGESLTTYGTHCWTEYYSFWDNIPTIDQVEPPISGEVYIQNQGEWTGAGMPQGARPETAAQELSSIYAAASSLSNDLKSNLEYALMLFNNNPALLRVYNTLRSHSWQITFKIDPTLKFDEHALYNTADKSIRFRTEIDVQEQFLEEELIHAAQHVYYGNKMLDKYNNFEFEAKLYRDIAGFFSETGGALFLTWNLPSNMFNEYSYWINDIVNRSNLSFTESDLEKYYKYLSATTLPGSPNLDIRPLVLLSLIVNLKH